MKKFLIILLTLFGFALVGCTSQQLSTVETDIGLAVTDVNQALTDLKDHPDQVNAVEALVQGIADKTGPLQSAAEELVKVFELYKKNQATIDQVQAALNKYNGLLTANKQFLARKAAKKN